MKTLDRFPGDAMLRNYRNDHEFYDSLPRKRVGTGALIFYKNDLLIVQPSYSDSWLLPGGTVEAEESPLEGLHRSLRESLQLDVEPLRLIAVDYIHNRDVKGEYLQFLFEVKALTESQAQKIQPRTEEFKNFKFVDMEKALTLLTANAARRLESAMIALQEGAKMIYLEDGNTPSFKDEMAFL